MHNDTVMGHNYVTVFTQHVTGPFLKKRKFLYQATIDIALET